jgi:hypothetical protein
MRRRTFFPLIGAALVYAANPGGSGPAAARPAPTAQKPTLATAPIEVGGDWAGSLPDSALRVVSRMRDACLTGVRLLSDRQPESIRVDNHTEGPPHIWLHNDHAPFAWIVVDVGARDWSRLAYQFGHELGHLMCNIWSPEGNAANPASSAWLEEALAEANAVRGLGLLADRWATDPPFPGDQAFAGAIRQYRDHLAAKYQKIAADEGATADLAAWFKTHRGALESNGDINGPASGAVATVLAEMTADPAGIEAVGALNRWPRQSGMSVEDYLRAWVQSCAEIGASPGLAERLGRGLVG